jgi:hypothetical protein
MLADFLPPHARIGGADSWRSLVRPPYSRLLVLV